MATNSAPAVGQTMQDGVEAYARHGNNVYVGVGKELMRFNLDSGENDRSAGLGGDIRSLAASSGGVVAAVGQTVHIFDGELRSRRTHDALGPVWSIVAGPSAAWLRWTARDVEAKGKGMLGQPMAMIMSAAVMRLGLTDSTTDQNLPLGKDWLVLAPNQPAGSRLELADREGNEAVALVSDFEDLIVVRRPLQRIVRMPSAGQAIVETRTGPPFVDQLVLSEGRRFWATQTGLQIEQSVVLQMGAGRGEWIPTSHGMFAAWTSASGQATTFKLADGGTLQNLGQLTGSVPETGLGKDAIIEDESGLWLTLNDEAQTRFVRLDADGKVAQTIEVGGRAYPVGVIGSRFYCIALDKPKDSAEQIGSSSNASLRWLPI